MPDHVAQPVQMLNRPVAADEGEHVGGTRLDRVQAGDVQHGLAVTHDPAAGLLDGDVAFEEGGLAGGRGVQAIRGGAGAGGGGRGPAAGERAGWYGGSPMTAGSS